MTDEGLKKFDVVPAGEKDSFKRGEDTQKEHREVAEAIRDIFCREFPNTAKALGWIDEN